MKNVVKTENQSLQHRSDRNSSSLIDHFFDQSFWDPFSMMTPGLFRSGALSGVSSAFPKVDVEETDKEIRVCADIPGIDPQNINIEVGDDYLSLSGRIEREERNKEQGTKGYRYEREYGEFRREFSLPARVNKDDIVAKAKNGVLTITLPKTEAEQKKKIKVEIE